MPKRLLLVIQIALTILLPLWLFRDFDWDQLKAVFSALPFSFYAISLLIFLLAQVIFASKWYLILRGMEIQVPFANVIEQHFIGVYFSNFVPTTVGGDGAKIYYLGKQEGYTNITASVFLDRFLGFFSITTLGMCLSWFMEFDTPAITSVRNMLSVLFLAFLAATALMIYFPFDRWWRRVFLRLPRLGFLEPRFNQLLAYTRLITQKPRLLVQVFVITFTYFGLIAVIYLFYFSYVTALSVHILPIMTVLLSIAILSNIPLTINGIGLREQLHFVLLAPLGLSKETTVTIALLIFFYFLLSSLIGYLCWVHLQMQHKLPLESAPATAD